MTSDQKNPSVHPEEDAKMPPANSGNASNPSPVNEMEQTGNNQLLDEKAEKYLRESASIEDMPDEQDWQDAEKTLKQENNNQ